jgi:glutathione S-transferase
VAVTLHRCRWHFLKIDAHACWRVQHALDEQGIEYRVQGGPSREGKRDELERLSGQRKYPVIEYVDGHAYRADSKEMAQRIREGRLFEGPAAG